MPGAGIDDDDDVREEPEGGATGCVEHAAAAGWDSCLIWGVDEVLWAGEDAGKEPEELSGIWIAKMNTKLFTNVKPYFHALKHSRPDLTLLLFNISLT